MCSQLRRLPKTKLTNSAGPHKVIKIYKSYTFDLQIVSLLSMSIIEPVREIHVSSFAQ